MLPAGQEECRLVLIVCENIEKNGSGGRSRTADLRVMNPTLSPTELPRQKSKQLARS
jgi:hypothetical protein